MLCGLVSSGVLIVVVLVFLWLLEADSGHS